MSTALQINLAPPDAPHAVHTLPHQLRQWAGQVDRVVLTVDTRPGTGRYASLWRQREPALRGLLEATNGVEVRAVDYSPATVSAISERFMGGKPIPAKDAHGAPFYAYLYGLWAAQARHVLHFDSDMLFGGGSQSWVSEAIAMLSAEPDVMVTTPFPGPPRPDGRLAPHVERSSSMSQAGGGPSVQLVKYGGALQFPHMSTRCFFVDTQRLGEVDLHVHPTPPGRLATRSPGPQPLEVSLSLGMQAAGLHRLDILGDGDGMWCLHPPFRGADFYQRLPGLIAAIEAGEVPDGQRGDYDLNDSMHDWTSERARVQRFRRKERLKRVMSYALRRVRPSSSSAAELGSDVDEGAGRKL